MIVLDENIRDSHADILRKEGIGSRKIGADLAWKGTTDLNIIPLLHRLKQPAFFTHDVDFWNPELFHAGYCIVHLAVKPPRRCILHPAFSSSSSICNSRKTARNHCPGIPDRALRKALASWRACKNRMVTMITMRDLTCIQSHARP
jgi:hypothetical protein